MFITYKRAEIMYPALFGDDSQMWRFVELMIIALGLRDD